MKRGSNSIGDWSKRLRIEDRPITLPANYSPYDPYFIFTIRIEGPTGNFASLIAEYYPDAFTWSRDFYVSDRQIGPHSYTYIHVPSLEEIPGAHYLFIPAPYANYHYMTDIEFAAEELADIEANLSDATEEANVNAYGGRIFKFAKLVNLTGEGLE